MSVVVVYASLSSEKTSHVTSTTPAIAVAVLQSGGHFEEDLRFLLFDVVRLIWFSWWE